MENVYNKELTLKTSSKGNKQTTTGKPCAIDNGLKIAFFFQLELWIVFLVLHTNKLFF